MISESVHKLHFLLIVREFKLRYLISIDGLRLRNIIDYEFKISNLSLRTNKNFLWSELGPQANF